MSKAHRQGRTKRSRSAPQARSSSPGQPSNAFEIDLSDASFFEVDNSELRAPTPGLAIRRSKDLNDRIKSGDRRDQRWGDIIRGIDEKDGWVRTQHGFLPKRLQGHRVLKVLQDRSQSARHAPPSLQAAQPSQTAVDRHPSLQATQEEGYWSASYQQAFQDMFGLFVRAAGGPGKTALMLLDVAHVELEDVLQNTGLQVRGTIEQIAHLTDLLLDRSAGKEDLGDVVKKLLSCILTGCCLLPFGEHRSRCLTPLVTCAMKSSVVPEAAKQLWVISTESLDRRLQRRPGWVYGSAILAAEIERCLLASSGESVPKEMIDSITSARVVHQNARYHLTFLAEEGKLIDEAVPKEVVDDLLRGKKDGALAGSSTGLPSDLQSQPSGPHFEAPATRTQRGPAEVAGTGRRSTGSVRSRPSLASRPSISKRRCSTAEDSNAEESEDIDSKSSEAESEDMGEDLGGFIDFSAEHNSHGFIDLACLPAPTKAIPGSSPAGLLAFLQRKIHDEGNDEIRKNMEAYRALSAKDGWQDHCRQLMKKRSLSSKPLPPSPKRRCIEGLDPLDSPMSD